MRVKACSLVPMVNSAGPEMDRAETVTMFNDLCVLAPAALVDAPVRWQEVDGRRVRGVFTNGVQTVTADLLFDDDDLVDFVSDDRMATTPDGKNFTPRHRRVNSATSSSSWTTSPTTSGDPRPPTVQRSRPTTWTSSMSRPAGLAGQPFITPCAAACPNSLDRSTDVLVARDEGAGAI
jgi:hypothetical protein